MSAVATVPVSGSQSTGLRTALLTDKYHLECVSARMVKDLDKERFNTNNHWTDGVRPSDYSRVLAAGQTRYWIDEFKPHYSVINLEARELRWMRKGGSDRPHDWSILLHVL